MDKEAVALGLQNSRDIQVAETARVHDAAQAKAARRRSREAAAKVGGPVLEDDEEDAWASDAFEEDEPYNFDPEIDAGDSMECGIRGPLDGLTRAQMESVPDSGGKYYL